MISELVFLFKLAFAGNTLSLLFISMGATAFMNRGGLLFRMVFIAWISDYIWSFISMRLDGHHFDIIFSSFLGTIINIPDNLIYYVSRLVAFFVTIQIMFMIRVRFNPLRNREILSPYENMYSKKGLSVDNYSEKRLRRLERALIKANASHHKY